MSTKPSYTGTIKAGTGVEVTEQIDNAHSKLTEYPLLPGDILFKREDGRWGKFGPGLGIEGFVLTDEQIENFTKPNEEQRFGMGGMDYFLEGD